jgi:acyl-coenzyme A thioesterase PaaI-like protein
VPDGRVGPAPRVHAGVRPAQRAGSRAFTGRWHARHVTDLSARAAAALAVPLQHALGARLADPADPTAGVVFPVAGLALNGAGGLHAGALAGILELAGLLAALPELGPDEHAVTHAIATQLVAAAPEGAEVTVTGTLDRRTRRLVFVTVAATAGETVIARAQITKSVVAVR